MIFQPSRIGTFRAKKTGKTVFFKDGVERNIPIWTHPSVGRPAVACKKRPSHPHVSEPLMDVSVISSRRCAAAVGGQEMEWQVSGRGNGWRLHRLIEVSKDAVDYLAPCDEGNDFHRALASGAHQR